MIKTQLQKWIKDYQDKLNNLTIYANMYEKEMKDMDINVSDYCIDPKYMLSLSEEFRQYQETQTIGESLQKLLKYPLVYRLNRSIRNCNSEIISTKTVIDALVRRLNNNPIEDCNEKNHEHLPGLDVNVFKRKYRNAINYVGNTEKYWWYDKERLSISFKIELTCKTCGSNFFIHVWKHYPFITEKTDSSKIYEIELDSDFIHNFPDKFLNKFLDRNEIMSELFDLLSSEYIIKNVENCL